MKSKRSFSPLSKTHVAILAVALWVLSPLSGLASGDPSPHRLAMEGSRLSAEEAAQLELQLSEDPNDLAARIQLLGYYRSKRSDEAREARVGHVLWIIRNHPGSPVAGTPFVHVNAILEAEWYQQAKSSWMEQVKLHESDAQVHGNAARFFTLHDRDLAAELLEKAQALDPADPQWPQQLGHLYSLGLSRKSDEERAEVAARSLLQFEKALAVADENARRAMLEDTAKTAFAAGELDKSRSYAVELVSEADESSWNYGNAIHHGNLILGRLALKAGDTEVAKLHLLEAGKTPGSPQLNSFGPNMLLAKELLAHGEQESVLEYFELCGEFWQSARGSLESWATDIREGRTPDFGANLEY